MSQTGSSRTQERLRRLVPPALVDFSNMRRCFDGRVRIGQPRRLKHAKQQTVCSAQAAQACEATIHAGTMPEGSVLEAANSMSVFFSSQPREEKLSKSWWTRPLNAAMSSQSPHNCETASVVGSFPHSMVAFLLPLCYRYNHATSLPQTYSERTAQAAQARPATKHGRRIEGQPFLNYTVQGRSSDDQLRPHDKKCNQRERERAEVGERRTPTRRLAPN